MGSRRLRQQVHRRRRTLRRGGHRRPGSRSRLRESFQRFLRRRENALGDVSERLRFSFFREETFPLFDGTFRTLEDGYFSDDFHIFEAEWRHGRVVFRVDGRKTGELTLPGGGDSFKLGPFSARVPDVLNFWFSPTAMAPSDCEVTFSPFFPRVRGPECRRRSLSRRSRNTPDDKKLSRRIY